MVGVLKEMFDWFWIFVWIFMLIPTSNNISFGFTYVIFLMRADSLIDFTWRVWVCLLQREKLPDFLCFPNNSKITRFFGENLIGKSFITLSTNLNGYPALENLLLIWFLVWEKFELILHERYKSIYCIFFVSFWHLHFLVHGEFISFSVNFSFYDIILQ